MFGVTSDLEKTAKCAAIITDPYLIAKFGSDDDTIAVAAGATDQLIGIIQHTTKAIGDEVRIMLDGISWLKLGDTVTRGGPITSDANGKGVPAVSGQNVICYAMASGVAGDLIPVLVEQQIITPNLGANGLNMKGSFRATFDATGGVAQGAHGLGVTLPDNAIVTRTWYEVLVTFTSATDAATIALGVPTDAAAGIKAAVAISNGANAWDAGKVEGIQTGTVANFLAKLTADRELTVTVAVEDLTAGKLVLYGEYVIGG